MVPLWLSPSVKHPLKYHEEPWVFCLVKEQLHHHLDRRSGYITHCFLEVTCGDKICVAPPSCPYSERALNRVFTRREDNQHFYSTFYLLILLVKHFLFFCDEDILSWNIRKHLAIRFMTILTWMFLLVQPLWFHQKMEKVCPRLCKVFEHDIVRNYKMLQEITSYKKLFRGIMHMPANEV